MTEPPAHQGWEQIWRRGGSYGDTPERQVVDLADRLKARGWPRVLDLGCGLGRHLLWLAAEGFTVWGCDVSPTAVAACHSALGGSRSRAGVLRAEMTALPFRDNVFDAAVAWDVIFHTTVEGILRTVAGVRR
jgi:tellurite methyltransferase